MADAKSQYNELVSIWDSQEKYKSWADSQGIVTFPGGYDENGYTPESYARVVGTETKYMVNDEGGISPYQTPKYETVADPKQTLMDQINTLAPQVGERPFVSTSADSKTNKIASEIAAQRSQYGNESMWQGGARAGFGGATGLDVQMAQDLASRGLTSLSQIKTKEVPNMVGSGEYDMYGGEFQVQQGTKKVAWNTVTDEPLARQGYQHQMAGQGNVWSGTYAGPGNTMYKVDFDQQGNPVFSTSGASSEDTMQYLAPALAFAAIASGAGALAPELLGAGELAGAAGLTGEAGALAAAGGGAGAAGAGLADYAALYGAEQIGGITAADLGLTPAAMSEFAPVPGAESGLDTTNMMDLLNEPAISQPVPAQPEIVSTPISDTGGLENLTTEELLQNTGYDAVESAVNPEINKDIIQESAGDFFEANTPVNSFDASAATGIPAAAPAMEGVLPTDTATAEAALESSAGLPSLKNIIPLVPTITRLLSDSGGGGGGVGGAGGWSGTVPRYEMVQNRLPLDDTGRRPGSAGRRYFSPVEYRPITDTTSGTYNPTEAIPTESQTGVNTGGFAGGGLAGLAQGRYLGGPTDGMADKIPANIEGKQPAALSHGEFVIPADVVSHLGNGNSDAGAQRLYSMMDKIRKARTGTAKQGKQINPDKYLPV